MMEERVTAVLEALTTQQRSLMEMMRTQTSQQDIRAKSEALSLRSSLASSVNTKGMIKVDEYKGEKSKFDSWKITFYNAIEALDSDACQKLRDIEVNLDSEQLIPDEANDKARCKTVATFLLNLCKDDAFTRVAVAETGNGYEAWRRLCRSKTVRSSAAAFTTLMNPIFTSADPRVNLQIWDRDALSYERKFGEKIPKGIRKSIYQTRICPQEVQQHLVLNAARFDSPEEIAEEIERYCDAREELAQSQGTDPFIAAVTDKVQPNPKRTPGRRWDP